MQHGKIPSCEHVPLECLQLPLRRVRVHPAPVFDVDAPGDDPRGGGHEGCEALACASAYRAVGRAEVVRCLLVGG